MTKQKEIIYSEEYETGIIPLGTPITSSRNVLWMDMEETRRDAPHLLPYFSKHPTYTDMCFVRDEMREVLLKKKIVFNGHTFYRYKCNREGILKDFGITIIDQ